MEPSAQDLPPPRQGHEAPLDSDGRPLRISRYYKAKLGDGDLSARKQLQEALVAFCAKSPSVALKVPAMAAGVLSYEQLQALMQEFDAAALK
mmetsp:Transcript_114703/g.244719  ORF Transcript_114703/g.244719 Transcript_114703/m.244719 type:complete len:92 (+) Transcript_114703:2-277(+)